MFSFLRPVPTPEFAYNILTAIEPDVLATEAALECPELPDDLEPATPTIRERDNQHSASLTSRPHNFIRSIHKTLFPPGLHFPYEPSKIELRFGILMAGIFMYQWQRVPQLSEHVPASGSTFIPITDIPHIILYHDSPVATGYATISFLLFTYYKNLTVPLASPMRRVVSGIVDAPDRAYQHVRKKFPRQKKPSKVFAPSTESPYLKSEIPRPEPMTREEKIAAYNEAKQVAAAEPVIQQPPVVIPKTPAIKLSAPSRTDRTQFLVNETTRLMRMSTAELVAVFALDPRPVNIEDTAGLETIKSTSYYKILIKCLVLLKHAPNSKQLAKKLSTLKTQHKQTTYRRIRVTDDLRIVYAEIANAISVQFIGRHQEYERFILNL